MNLGPYYRLFGFEEIQWAESEITKLAGLYEQDLQISLSKVLPSESS
jgi:hypothetical protein